MRQIEPKLRVAISTCLLGKCVRYDGGHKLDRVIIDALEDVVEWVAICPETECGLTVPREAMQLVGDAGEPRLVMRKSHADQTERLRAWARKKIEEMSALGLAGVIFKARSPSCGMHVEVLKANGKPHGYAPGLFAQMCVARFPDLPVSEDDPLHDPRRREEFLARLKAAAGRPAKTA